MTLQGKGFFITDLSACEAGEPISILAASQAAGLSHLLVKIADGVNLSNFQASGIDLALQVVQVMHAAGIQVWGWHAIYGNDPSTEASLAIKRLQTLGLDGYVVDAGPEFQHTGMATVALKFMTSVRSALTIPIALHSYRFPNYHPEFPWSTFLKFCDLQMPKVYWDQAHNAGEQLLESRRQCDSLPNARPYVPTAATCTISGWSPSSEEISDFMATARRLDLPAINFFDWDNCRGSLEPLWAEITSFSSPVPSQGSAPIPYSLPAQVGTPNDIQEPSQPIPDSFPVQAQNPTNIQETARSVPDVLPDQAGIPDNIQEPSQSIPDSLHAQTQNPTNIQKTAHSVPDVLPDQAGIPDNIQKPSQSIPDTLPINPIVPAPIPDTLPDSDKLPVTRKKIPTAISESLPPAEKSSASQPDAFSLEFLAALNQHAATQVAAFFAVDAVQVWGGRILHGVPSIQNNFETFFASLPAKALFTLSHFQSHGDQRFFTWHAGSYTGETSLLVKNGKILQDYTLIT